MHGLSDLMYFPVTSRMHYYAVLCAALLKYIMRHDFISFVASRHIHVIMICTFWRLFLDTEYNVLRIYACGIRYVFFVDDSWSPLLG